MNAVVVLQARTSSSRLPAKVLLPLGGFPMVVLAALRAGNTGRRVLVATSDQRDDEALAGLLSDHGIDCFRGSLEDTLGRFVSALDGLDDGTMVVRLTADNPLPDGSLIDEVIAEFADRRLGYLACNGAPSGVPYGLSVEVTTAGLLREAARNTVDPADREHVTPYVIRKCGSQWFRKYATPGKGHLRCTVDGYDDYQVALHVFSGEPDPVNVSAMRLVAKLATAPFQPVGGAPVPKLVVGGAQLGMPYGVANLTGRPTAKLAAAMLKCAVSNGVRWIDTARAYAGSEETIGESLFGGWNERVRVVTKLAPLAELTDQCDESAVRASVDASIYASCAQLRRGRLDTVLLHRAPHLSAWGGAAWRRLLELQAEGRIGSLGVSVQTPHELVTALDFEDVSFIQMPFNLLDWRWDEVIDRLSRERAGRQITVHARSALLQGLLASHHPGHWRRAHVDPSDAIRQWLSDQAACRGRESVVDLCLAFVRSQPWIDGVVIGMETMEQLRDNVRYFLTPSLAVEEVAAIRRDRPLVSAETLDPSRWGDA